MRDNFSRDVMEQLSKRAGSQCSNPTCQKVTSGPNTDPAKAINIGVAAHIAAASPGGPRFDSAMTPDQRSDIDNAIWLCQTCAKLVDSDVKRYNLKSLREWKRGREERALAALEGRGQGASPAPAEIKLVRRNLSITKERHDYELEVHIKNTGTEPFIDFNVDLEMPLAPVHRPETMFLLVKDRSTNKAAYFRFVMVQHRPGATVYPGDTITVLKIQYFMNNALYSAQQELFNAPVRATMYLRGHAPISCEQRFEELQIY
jgi:hypothetical protein